MKKNVRIFGNGIAIIVTGAVLAAVLMTLAFMMPVNSEIVSKSTKILDDEGWYPIASIQQTDYVSYFNSYEPDVIDGSTDKVMVTIALDDTAEGNALVRAMNAYGTHVGGNYQRYWHGYSIILRPLMYFFDYVEIRFFNNIAQMILMFLLVKLLWDKKGIGYALAAGSMYLLLHPIALGKTLQFSWVFYIGIISSIFIVKSVDKIRTKSRYIYLFIIIGMLTSFFDLLTYPLFTWGIPIITLLLMSREEESPWSHLIEVIYSGIAWIAGYAGMWAMKWVISSIVLGENIIKSALGSVLFRLGTEGDSWSEALTLGDRIAVLYTNWKHYDNKEYFIILAVWVIMAYWYWFRHGIRKSSKTPALLLTAVSSIVWYLIVANHTQVHHFFTYRIYSVAILAVIAIILVNMRRDQLLSRRQRCLLLGRFCAYGVISILIVSAFAKEPVKANSAIVEARYILLEENGKLEVDFCPTYSKVRKFLLCTKTESTKGYYQVSLLQDQELLYQRQFPMQLFEEYPSDWFDVEWDLEAGESYRLEIEAIDVNEDAYVVITAEGLQPLAEYRDLQINGQDYPSQPSTGFTYWCLPTSEQTLCFLLLTCMGVFLAIELTVASCIRKK